ncbi:hypothetical protein MAMC_00274 [Methylacidimicrobium cyclopophantes]|uniref:Uncharacterized protein n=1 Tax=Methylacidimicrobium cyclopophantes TaxID=1041766 RepID=A0A5E6MAW6_9BACT|nr:hypothetical protein [Methylacidimicrobium cyclopophantes]VVM04895.1 hypothetical protein MAMC_00274 [Methylacidimicrobium cyclopophantes]
MSSLAKIIKFVLALSALPLLMAELLFLKELLESYFRDGAWFTLPVASFAGGLLLWTLLCFLWKVPQRPYIFAHELTHALAVYLHGGRVSRFRVGDQSGSIRCNRSNLWIVLSPYFVPFYMLLWLGLWTIVDFYRPIRSYQWLLYAGTGFTWGFHLFFTVEAVHGKQPDLHVEGWFFSLVFITGLNLLILAALLGFLSPSWTVSRFLSHFGDDLLFCYRLSQEGFAAFASWIGSAGLALRAARADRP